MRVQIAGWHKLYYPVNLFCFFWSQNHPLTMAIGLLFKVLSSLSVACNCVGPLQVGLVRQVPPGPRRRRWRIFFFVVHRSARHYNDRPMFVSESQRVLYFGPDRYEVGGLCTSNLGMTKHFVGAEEQTIPSRCLSRTERNKRKVGRLQRNKVITRPIKIVALSGWKWRA